ncbi:MAG TPA: dTDP-glucose 4,6-dehydratase [Gemmatimonadaceae bacterium]|nr:dTDP-glucose 4,6-dehydratase [Gemmatimonadaceae bacterium]
MRRVLVTGAAGFIGSNFVQFWAEHHPGDKIIGLDALTYAGNLASLEPVTHHKQFGFVKGDIRDGDAVRDIIKREGIDTIVHFAAESHVDRSIHGPDPFIDTNVRGTHELLKAARAVWTEDWSGGARRFHQISTDEVYGNLNPTGAPFTEETAYAPNSPYAASKAGSDHLVRAYHHTYGLPVTTTNCSNNYGPYHFPEKLIPLAIVNALDGKPIPVYGDGLQIRDWLYVRDHCRGIERVLEKGRVGETYNLGGNAERQNLDVVKSICAHLDKILGADEKIRERFPKCPAALGGDTGELIKFVKDRPGHDRRYAIDAMKATLETGYGPSESFETGLLKTVKWYIANEAWWRAVMDGSYRDWVELNYSTPKKGK